MTVAVPVWEARVSPLFDTAQRIALADTTDGSIRGLKVLPLPNQTFKECIDFLCDYKVKVLICGAISQPLSRMIGTRGIVLIPWVAGSVEEVINAYIEGCLGETKYSMPGSLPFEEKISADSHSQHKAG